eukprot:8568872-Pyramimonas_sp.AAC.1
MAIAMDSTPDEVDELLQHVKITQSFPRLVKVIIGKFGSITSHLDVKHLADLTESQRLTWLQVPGSSATATERPGSRPGSGLARM